MAREVVLTVCAESRDAAHNVAARIPGFVIDHVRQIATPWTKHVVLENEYWVFGTAHKDIEPGGDIKKVEPKSDRKSLFG